MKNDDVLWKLSVIYDRLTPFLVLLASDRRPDVDLKAIEISEEVLRLGCRRSSG